MTFRRFAIAPLVWAFASSCTGAAGASLLEFLSCSDLSDMSVAPVPEIRMLVLYTEQARDEAAGASVKGIEVEIQHAVLEANAVMAWSGVPLHVALAHMELLTGVTDGGALTMRQALVAGTDPVYAKAHELREKWHADVVALVTTSVGGNAEPMVKPGMAASPSAFLVAGREYMGTQFTLTHELGHLLGGVHQLPLAAADMPSYSYAFPRIEAGGAWRTMMATPGATRIEHFSNPDVLYFVDPDDPDDTGWPTGTPITDAAPADNRRTLINTGPIVSAYRYTQAWFASSAAVSPWFEKRAGDELMTDVRFADLNGDKQTDAFKIAPDGSWLISLSARETWIPLRGIDPLSAPIGKLRFADLVGDGADDVFYVDGSTWQVSESGSGAWIALNADPSIAGVAVEDLDFGEFSDATTKADVFRSDAGSGTWYVSRNGTTALNPLFGPDGGLKFPTKELRLGDFDGDRITDVFRSEITPTKAWYWSRSGVTAWAPLITDDAVGFPVDDLLFGDFDGDGTTDVLRPDGVTWYLSLRGQTPPTAYKFSCVKPNNMALGDFDGDGTTDVIRAGIRP